jgi:hypothetical protein
MYISMMNAESLNSLERSRNRPEFQRPKNEMKPQQPQSKLDGETEAQYVERLTAEYKAKASATTPPALMARAVSFIQAMASKVFESPATEEMQAARLNTCYSCEFFQVAFDAPEQGGHCAACGCGKSKMTSLPEKAKILKSSCIKGYWDISISIDPDALPSFSRRAE